LEAQEWGFGSVAQVIEGRDGGLVDTVMFDVLPDLFIGIELR
jgi:hypothetical protein